jgi:hypothetical protein
LGDVICNHIQTAKNTDFLAIDKHSISGWKGNDPGLPDHVSYVLQHRLDYTINSEYCTFNSLRKAFQDGLGAYIHSFKSDLQGHHDLRLKENSSHIRTIHVGSIHISIEWQSPHIVASESISQACNWLESFVVSPLDKNTKCVFVETPFSYATRMTRTFIKDDHYNRVELSEIAIMKHMHNTYVSNKWHRLGAFARNSSLGYAYVLPKNKDPIGKNRPIVPATKHPLRRILKLAAKAWLYLISKADFRHFNISATHELKHFTYNTNRALSCQPTLIAFDVKNMFTELKHEHVLSALSFLVHRTSARYHCRAVTVSKKGEKKAWLGKSPGRMSCITYSFRTLLQLAKFELDNTYFKVGTSVILQQKIGLSMGGYLSPPLAMIVAMVAEYKWLSALGADQRLLAGVRYVDDGLIVINSDDASIIFKIFGSLLYSCYPEGLELEVTSFGLVCHMLECVIKSSNSRLHICHYNKNARSVLSGQGQIIKKFIPWNSGYPHKLLFNVVVGLFHRIFDNTSALDVKFLVPSIVSYCSELRDLGYPERLIFKAFRNFMCHQKCVENLNSWRNLYAVSLALAL